MRFEVQTRRFHFRAVEQAVLFPTGKSGNVVRGAFGRSLLASSPSSYKTLFQPRSTPGTAPSGLADPPRPFVIRAWNCDGRTIAPGETFWFDIHRFDVRSGSWEPYIQAFERFAQDGIGPRQSHASLIEAGPPTSVCIDLQAADGFRSAAHHLTVEFVTPTEIKSNGKTIREPEFGLLFSRIRDRLSTLSTLYGEGPLPIDFRAIAERAAHVRKLEVQLVRKTVARRSGRTGRDHPIGGFTGVVRYENPAAGFGEFIPYLEAARWSGVGRQTVWGNGEIRFTEGERERMPELAVEEENPVR